MEQRNMLFQGFLHTCHLSQNVQIGASLQYDSAQYASSCHKIYTSVWINGACFFRLIFGLIILPPNLQEKPYFLYESMEYALSGWTLFWPCWHQTCILRIISCMRSMLFQVRLQTDHVIHFTLVSLLPKYPHLLTQFLPQFSPQFYSLPL